MTLDKLNHGSHTSSRWHAFRHNTSPLNDLNVTHMLHELVLTTQSKPSRLLAKFQTDRSIPKWFWLHNYTPAEKWAEVARIVLRLSNFTTFNTRCTLPSFPSSSRIWLSSHTQASALAKNPRNTYLIPASVSTPSQRISLLVALHFRTHQRYEQMHPIDF